MPGGLDPPAYLPNRGAAGDLDIRAGHRPLHAFGDYCPDSMVALLVILTVWRLTRLVVKDEFPPVLLAREWVEEKRGETSAITYLVNCPWCSSVWLAAAVVVGYDLLAGDVEAPVLLAAAAALVTGYGMTWLERD